MRWIVYQQLFGTSKARVDLLNEMAGGAFWLIEESLWLDIQLALCRIGDPAVTGKRENLTLRRLQSALQAEGVSVLVKDLDPHLAEFESLCEKVRERRNKLLAHSDLAARLAARERQEAALALNVTLREVGDAIECLRAAMNCVEIHYDWALTGFDGSIVAGDGDNLIAGLARAQRYHKLLKERKISVEDVHLIPHSLF